MNTSSYQLEQAESLSVIHRFLRALSNDQRQYLVDLCADYMLFRGEVDLYLMAHFSDICAQSCYMSRRSACCSREGIVTFFADMVINALYASGEEVARLFSVLKETGKPGKCIYLGEHGCLWKVKPIVCQMFLCDRAKTQVFDIKPFLRKEWERLERCRKMFTWPDQPVLFDVLEEIFIDAGITSPLMYLHNSPGLLRIKEEAGLRADKLTVRTRRHEG